MTARKPHALPRLAGPCLLLLLLCAQPSALGRGGGFPHDEPWSSERIDRLPPEVRNSVLHMCRVRPTAAHYFATYLDDARIIKLHFENLNWDGTQTYRHGDRCLREEFRLTGSHYQLAGNYYGRCDD